MIYSFSVSIFLPHIICLLLREASALDNGLALTPPMGYISWARFYCQVDCSHHPTTCISEQLYMQMADRMVSDGFLELGYNYVNMDDCWMARTRDSEGKLTGDLARFPHGIKWLANYMHERGLKFGIYEDYGNKTCAGYPGSLYHLKLDASTFAEWKIDSLKLDGCYVNISKMHEGFPQMGRYLNETGRPILYACDWPLRFKKLVIGNPGVTVDQAKAQMAIWSIWSAPLFMSNDLRFLAPAFKEILQNRKIIAVDQDPLGIMGRMVANTTNVRVYVKPVTPKDNRGMFSYAFAFLNVHDTQTASVFVTLSVIGLTNPTGYFVEDLYSGEKHGLMHPGDKFSCSVPPTGVVMLKATVSTSI